MMPGSLLIFGPRESIAAVTRSAQLTQNVATAVFAFADLLSLAIPTNAGRQLWIMFTMSGDAAGGAQRTGKFRIRVDGADLVATGETFRNNRTGSCSVNIRTTGLSAGLHTVTVQWARDAGPPGSIRINAATDTDEHHAVLTAQEVAI